MTLPFSTICVVERTSYSKRVLVMYSAICNQISEPVKVQLEQLCQAGGVGVQTGPRTAETLQQAVHSQHLLFCYKIRLLYS